MNAETARIAIQLLQRVQIQGLEVPAYTQVMQALIPIASAQPGAHAGLAPNGAMPTIPGSEPLPAA